MHTAVLIVIIMATCFLKSGKDVTGKRKAWSQAVLAVSASTKVSANPGSYGYPNDVFFLSGVHTFSSLGRGACVKLAAP